MKNLFFVIVCVFSTVFSLEASDVSCPAPQNVHKVSETSSSISFDWNDCFCSGQTFQVYYVKNGVPSAPVTVNSSEVDFSNLTTGTYEFHFVTTCISGTSVDVIIIEDIIET